MYYCLNEAWVKVLTFKKSLSIKRIRKSLGSEIGIFDIVAFALFFVLGLLVISRELPLSPIDEQAHIDYVLKAGQLQLPGNNEYLSQDTMKIMSCNGIDSGFDIYLSPCTQEIFDPNAYPDLGFSEASDASPTYYLTTGLLARSLRDLSPIDDQLFSVRLANWIWIALSGSLLTVILRRRGGGSLFSFSIAALMISNPVALTAGVNVSPDSQLPLAGLLLYLITRSILRKNRISFFQFLGATLLCSIDRSMVLPFLACLVLLIFGFALSRKRTFDELKMINKQFLLRGFFALGSLLFAFFAGPIVLDLLRLWYSNSLGERLITLPRDSWFPRPLFTWEVFFNGWVTSFPPIRGGYLIPPLRTFDYGLVTDVSAMTVAGGVFAAVFAAKTRADQIESMTIWFFGFFGLPILTFLLWLRGGAFWTLTPRFGLGMLGLLFLLCGISAKNRLIKSWISIIAIASCAVISLRIISYPIVK